LLIVDQTKRASREKRRPGTRLDPAFQSIFYDLDPTHERIVPALHHGFEDEESVDGALVSWYEEIIFSNVD
jgi:hypothetical protein